MQELEKILEEIDKATDEYGMVDYINDEPVISKSQAKNIIRRHMNDGWIPVEERLPEKYISVLVQWEKYDRSIDETLIYLDVMWLEDEEDVVFETINGIPNGRVIA